MLPTDPLTAAVLSASVILILSLFAMHMRQGGSQRRSARREALDTVASWPPEAARVLTASESQAHELLKRAMPGFLVLAQVPLSRFLRVPTRNSYVDWLQRVGNLNADLLLCDSSSRVLAVIDVRVQNDSERSRRRHDRMARVLRAAGIGVYIWREGELPGLAEVRTLLGAEFTRATGLASAPAARQASSGPMPLIPVPEISELLAEGDAAAEQYGAMEPVPSAFFEDLDNLPAASARVH
ncbi:MAG TPA: DUF2726 domain-containing protein [Rubrivivax sp.]